MLLHLQTIGPSLIRLHPFTANATEQQAHLRILETTDLHVHIFPYDYYNEQSAESQGLARTATLITSARREAANNVLVDNGDFLQGSPIGDFVAYNKGFKLGDIHPIIASMNLLGYDAATLGNHEFNYGIDFLTKSLAHADFPVVCANAAHKIGATPLRDDTLISPYVILKRDLVDGQGNRHPIRIGIIGFLPPQTQNWDDAHLRGKLLTRDIVKTAEAYIPQMKEQGADIIVALSHSGIAEAQALDGMENASVPLARIEGIDAIVTGHSHLIFPSPMFQNTSDVDVTNGKISGKPAVMGGFWGSHLGLIDLLLERSGTEWKVIASKSEARPIAARDATGTLRQKVDSSAHIENASAGVHRATQAYMRRSVGETEQHLHSYFALVANSPALQLVCEAQAWYVAQKLAGTVHEHLPLLSAAAPFKAGGRAGPENYTDVPKGGLALRNIADLYAFPNSIRAVRIPGWLVAHWIERSAALFNQIEPGKPDQQLLNPAFPSYHFDVMAGVTYQIDPSQPSRFSVTGELVNPTAKRVQNLLYLGKPLDPEAEFIVATNSYRVGICDILSDPKTTTLVYQEPITNRDVLLRYIANHQPVKAIAKANWRLVAAPGTSFLFDSSPRAQSHMNEAHDVHIEHAGDAPNGFARFRIHA